MPNVPDRLFPTAGLTDSRIHFSGLTVPIGGTGCILRFEILDEVGLEVGTLQLPVSPQPKASVDAMIADGFGQLRDILRQWLHDVDEQALDYESRATVPPVEVAR